MKTTRAANTTTAPPALREMLADSYVAAVAILVMLLWTFDWIIRGLVQVVPDAAMYLATIAAIRGVPADPVIFRAHREIALIYFLLASSIAIGAGLLSQWVYGASPFRSLQLQRERFTRRPHV
ncbi:MAG TPA: hypothetical protein VGD60_03130 [Candidatus Acidoferrales bacterium]